MEEMKDGEEQDYKKPTAKACENEDEMGEKAK
jgi:hypothetical protein